jgi:hypothetical protein
MYGDDDNRVVVAPGVIHNEVSWSARMHDVLAWIGR